MGVPASQGGWNSGVTAEGYPAQAGYPAQGGSQGQGGYPSQGGYQAQRGYQVQSSWDAGAAKESVPASHAARAWDHNAAEDQWGNAPRGGGGGRCLTN